MIRRATVVVPLSGALTAASSWAIGTALLNKGDEENSAEMTAEKDGAAEAASALVSLVQRATTERVMPHTAASQEQCRHAARE